MDNCEISIPLVELVAAMVLSCVLMFFIMWKIFGPKVIKYYVVPIKSGTYALYSERSDGQIEFIGEWPTLESAENRILELIKNPSGWQRKQRIESFDGLVGGAHIL